MRGSLPWRPDAKNFSCWDQYLAMAFAQLTYRESLRDIETCLGAVGGKLYHMGFRTSVARSTLADANESRDWRLYADFAQTLIATAHRLYAREPLGVDLDESLCAGFDDHRSVLGTVSVGPLPAKQGGGQDAHATGSARQYSGVCSYQRRQGARCERAGSDHPRGKRVLRDGPWLHRFRAALSLDLAWRLLPYPSPQEFPFPQAGLASGRQNYRGAVRPDDRLVWFYTAKGYRARLRRIHYWDAEREKRLVFLTINFTLPAKVIADLYRCRWQVGASRQGHINQSVKVRPRPRDSGLVAGEAAWHESKTTKPSDNILRKEYAQHTRLQRTVNDVASLHANPVAETVDNVRKQQGLTEKSPMRQPSPAGYQRRHGVKADVSTGEALGARRRNPVGEMSAITASGKCRHRHQGGGSDRSTDDGRAAKRARREGSGPVSIPPVKVRQG